MEISPRSLPIVKGALSTSTVNITSIDEVISSIAICTLNKDLIINDYVLLELPEELVNKTINTMSSEDLGLDIIEYQHNKYLKIYKRNKAEHFIKTPIKLNKNIYLLSVSSEAIESYKPCNLVGSSLGSHGTKNIIEGLLI